VTDIPENGPVKLPKLVGERRPTVVNSAVSVHAVGSS
jgi:hypothetical protein